MPISNLDEFSCRIFVPRQSSKRRSWRTTFWKTFLQARWTSKPGGWGWFWIRLNWLQFFLRSGSRAGGGNAWEEGSQGLLCDQRRSSPDIYVIVANQKLIPFLISNRGWFVKNLSNCYPQKFSRTDSKNTFFQIHEICWNWFLLFWD